MYVPIKESVLFAEKERMPAKTKFSNIRKIGLHKYAITAPMVTGRKMRKTYPMKAEKLSRLMIMNAIAKPSKMA